ncbi:hypothetical protein HYZ64_02970 [Candidatus Berkelbacteria bacterium]|nr:hypothetical protein [Candidatus Berkelbacteria bacterium]
MKKEVKKLRLFHVSSDPGLRQLTPKVPDFRLPEEPEIETVCAATEWWQCLMLLPQLKVAEEMYLYEVVEVEKFAMPSGWLWATHEVRATDPVLVKLLGRLLLSNPDVAYATSRPCGNCGQPWMFCGDGGFCEKVRIPPLEAVLVPL